MQLTIRGSGKRPLSLIRSILLQILAGSLTAVLLVSAYTYHSTYSRVRSDSLEELRTYVGNRVRDDSEIFRLAEDNLAVFSEEFLKLYNSSVETTEQEFWTLYFTDAAGATRMKRDYFDGVYSDDGSYTYGLSSFIGNNQSVTDPDLQRRLILSARLLAQLGPAWVNRFANVHVAYPENAITLFYPTEPWGLIARPDLPMNELGVIRSVNQTENPERKDIWSGLYYDETAQEWTLTYMAPLDVGDKHLITPAHDIHLSDLVNRLIDADDSGAYNFVIRTDGYLVAHPSGPTDDQRWVGQLSLEKIDLPMVSAAYGLISQAANGDFSSVRVLADTENKNYLAVGQFDGPNWLLVRVFPMRIVAAAANAAAIRAAAAGVTVLAILLLVVYVVIRRQAERPLQQLMRAALALGQGEYAAVAERRIPLPTELGNEVGLLAARFTEMAARIRDSQENLEKIVEERTKALEHANASLMEMSLLDGLTGIHNRRSFDRSIARVFEDARAGLGTFCVMMIDIDFFKLYNDSYGHAEGDLVLTRIAMALAEHIRAEDRVFRYGGEEFVVIFNHADTEIAGNLAEHLMRVIAELRIPHHNSPYGFITISAGIEEFSARAETPEQVVRGADEKLYRAKNQGRNQVIA